MTLFDTTLPNSARDWISFETKHFFTKFLLIQWVKFFKKFKKKRKVFFSPHFQNNTHYLNRNNNNNNKWYFVSITHASVQIYQYKWIPVKWFTVHLRIQFQTKEKRKRKTNSMKSRWQTMFVQRNRLFSFRIWCARDHQRNSFGSNNLNDMTWRLK